MNFDYLNSELHADVQNLKAGKANNDAPPYSDVLSAFKYVKYLFSRCFDNNYKYLLVLLMFKLIINYN